MIRIISNNPEWSSWLNSMDNFDFYHTFEYHISLSNNTDTPIMIAYDDGHCKIGIPFIKRTINSKYYDLTSVHGYVGPVSYNIDDSFDNKIFKKELDKLLKSENIVSVFSKLNPFITHQELIIKNLGSTAVSGPLAYFDQSMDDTSQTEYYNRNTRQKINQLKKICTVKTVNSDIDISKFKISYYESLDRLKAKELFYFTDDYFKTLFNSNMFESKIFLAIHNETKEIMAGALCIKSQNIVHIELAFTNYNYYQKSPLRIIFDYTRKYYKNEEIKYLNLGGGTGGIEGSLMKFKLSFSKSIKYFKVWKYVVSEHIYKGLITPEQNLTDNGYFPKYRV